MDYRPLGSSGVEVSRIILGCGNFGGIGSAPAFFGQGTGREDAFALLDAAWEAGITTLDTADAYGGGASETYIGEWLATKDHRVRDTVVIATKTFNPMTADADCGLSPTRINRQINDSLRRLGVARVALYLAHEFDPAIPLEHTQGVFDDLIRDGKVGAVGASNFSDEQLRAALASSSNHDQGRYEWVQNSFSLLERGDTGSVLARCQEHGLGYTPFSPLAGGWLTGKYRRGQPPPSGSRMTLRPEPYEAYRHDHVYTALETLEQIALDHGLSMAVVSLAWALAQPGLTAIVIGPNRVEHLQPALDAAASGLPTDLFDNLSELFS